MSAIRDIAKNCLFARFSVHPVPDSLSRSVDIYTHLNSIGPLILYNQAICPVTKKRLGNINVLFQDVNRHARSEKNEKSYDSNESLDLAFSESFPLGDLVAEGKKLFSDQNFHLLSDMEKQLFEKLEVVKDDCTYTLNPFLVSRSLDKIMHGSIYSNAKWLKVTPRTSSPLDEVEKILQKKRDETLQGFQGLW